MTFFSLFLISLYFCCFYYAEFSLFWCNLVSLLLSVLNQCDFPFVPHLSRCLSVVELSARVLDLVYMKFYIYALVCSGVGEPAWRGLNMISPRYNYLINILDIHLTVGDYDDQMYFT